MFKEKIETILNNSEIISSDYKKAIKPIFISKRKIYSKTFLIRIDYQKLKNELEIIRAIDDGFVPTTASKWYRGMLNPFAPDFYLKTEGKTIGGHAYRTTWYRVNPYSDTDHDLENPQTFGAMYGDQGRAWSETLFGNNYYDNWICLFNGNPKP